MKAKYAGVCKRCGVGYPVGIEIYKPDGYWKPVKCPGCVRRDQALDLSDLLQDRMQKHGIGLGIFDNRPGTRGTFTRRDFLEECQRHHEISDNELELISWFWMDCMAHDFSD